MLIVLFALLGIAGIVGGARAWRFVRQASEETTHAWFIVARRVAIGAGAVLGLASFPLTGAMGYPYAGPREVGHIAGVPFMVAYFDAAGRDYVGPSTLPAALGNVAFWALLPQLVLAGYVLAVERRHHRR